MLTITDRQKDILDKIIREYVSSAEPVPSQILEKKYDFGLSPATIRGEMHKLTEEGFLYQPHTSAGRVPTDKGYRLFVNGLLEKDVENHEVDNWITKEINDSIKLMQKVTDSLANKSGALAFSYIENDDLFWKEGWEEILKEPEFNEKDYLFSFTDLLEEFQNNIKRLNADSEIKICIGKENPIAKAKKFTIIYTKSHLPDNKEVIFSLLGPTRMEYEKNIGLFNSLTKLFNEMY